MASVKEPRRPNLATIVGSSLAVVAAGSLLAFSTLAEQAGLEGLASGRLQPTVPGRTGSGGHVITVPAPSTAPPGDPREALAELVRETVQRPPAQERSPQVVAPAEPPSPDEPEPKRTRRIDESPKVAVTEPPVEDDVEAAEPDGPPYGHAYGHYKNKDKHKDKHEDPKHGPKSPSSEQPVYARKANDDGGSKAYKPSKPAKLEKVKKVKKTESPGNGNSKHAGNGKAKGHSKHAHKGKGKGHSKHGG